MCYKGNNSVSRLVMKKNACIVICALATLAVCMVLGAVFGANDFSGTAAAHGAYPQLEDVNKAVVNAHK